MNRIKPSILASFVLLLPALAHFVTAQAVVPDSSVAPQQTEIVDADDKPDGKSGDDSKALSAAVKTDALESLARELRSKYVFPDVAEKMAVAIEKSVSQGEYNAIEDVNKFATHLTDQLRAICNDKHFRVRAGLPPEHSRSPGRRAVDNHGFVKVEVLPGGIGYLKFNYFSGDQEAQATASAAMNFLANCHTLIFDLRENGGGSPDMIAYLSSYLFEEPVHLNSFYNRPTDTTTETWTQQDVPGKRFAPETKVFVLTSANTFSGAEEFTYNLKNLKRGTIIGETTGGGAHPVMPVALGKHLYVTMPFARAINPITQTNWEGVGVEPDVAVAAKLALEKAIQLAQDQRSGLAANSTAAMEKTETSQVDLAEMMQEATRLMDEESFVRAVTVFAKITELDPKNGEAWFRYGYCLHLNGDLEKAMEAHKKAAEFEAFRGIATYNQACAYSLLDNADEAFAHLEKAIAFGFRNPNQLANDSDFDNIRKDQRFSKLIKKLKARK